MSGLSDEAKRRLALLGAEGPGADAEARVRQGLERALGVVLPVGSLAAASGATASGATASGATASGATASGATASGAAATGATASGAALAGAAAIAAGGGAASSATATGTAAAGATAATAASASSLAMSGGVVGATAGTGAAMGSGWLVAAVTGLLVSAGAGVGYLALGERSPAPGSGPSSVVDTPPSIPAAPTPAREEPQASAPALTPVVEVAAPKEHPIAREPGPVLRPPATAAPGDRPRAATAPPPEASPPTAPAPTTPEETTTVAQAPEPSTSEEAEQLDPELSCDGDAELRFAQAAERHLERANAAHALALLDAFGRRCPSGHWSELTWAVRLGSLCTLGRGREASQLVAWHREEHGKGTARLLERTQRWCTSPAE